jgi:hypothetical protein
MCKTCWIPPPSLSCVFIPKRLTTYSSLQQLPPTLRFILHTPVIRLLKPLPLPREALPLRHRRPLEHAHLHDRHALEHRRHALDRAPARPAEVPGHGRAGGGCRVREHGEVFFACDVDAGGGEGEVVAEYC